MDRTSIKWIAIICMTMNHTAHVLLPSDTLAYKACIWIGYFTAVTMCYFLSEGCRYTHDRKRYAARLLICAVLSQIPYTIALHLGNLNMMFSLFLVFCILIISEGRMPFVIRLLISLPVLFLSLYTDWALSAPVFAFLFYRYGKRGYLPACIFYLCWHTINTGSLFGSLIFTVPLVLSGCVIRWIYNGQKGKDMKWFFYIFYPAHLAVLAIIARIA